MRFDLPYVKVVKINRDGSMQTVYSGIRMQQAVAYVEWLENYVPDNYTIVSQKNGKPVDEFGNEVKDNT